MRAALFALLLGGCQLVFKLEEAPVDASLNCGSGYESLDLGNGTKGLYRFSVVEQASWVIAESDCRKDGPTTHLAVLGSSTSQTAELNVVFQRARQLEAGGSSADVMVGLSAHLGQEYKWVTDEQIPIPTGNPPWGSGEPADPMNGLCVEIDVQSGTLVTIGCDQPDAYVCECDAFFEQPANF